MNQFGTLCIIALASVALAADNLVVDNTRIDIYSAICAREEHGSLLADPYDCSQFIQCDYGRAAIKKCSAGLRFDTRLQVCNWEGSVHCETPSQGGTTPTDGPVRCYGYDTLHFIADTSNCEKYYICANGVPYQHQCAPGINWDYLNNQCESPAKAQCAGKGDNNQPDSTSTAAPVTTAEPVTEPIDVLPDCTTGQKFFGCHDNCSEYYVCSENNVAFRMKCPNGYFWNEDDVKCDVPEMSRCIHPEV